MINKTQVYAQETSTNWLPNIEEFGSINQEIGRITRRSLNIMASKFANNEEGMEKNFAGLNDFKTKIDKKLKDYSKLLAPGEQPFYDVTLASYNEYIKVLDEQMSLLKENKTIESYQIYVNKGLPALTKFMDAVDKESQFNSEGATGSTKQGSNLTSITNLTMTIVLICSLIISTIIIIVILKLTNTIKGSIESLKKQGDSTMKISKILMQSSQSLSESVTEQAASVHETTAAINEITSMVNKTSENAQESNVVAKDASQKAESRKQPRDHEKIGK